MITVDNFFSRSPLVNAILEHIKGFHSFDCLFYTGDLILDDKETLALNKLGIRVVRNESEQTYKLNWQL